MVDTVVWGKSAPTHDARYYERCKRENGCRSWSGNGDKRRGVEMLPTETQQEGKRNKVGNPGVSLEPGGRQINFSIA